MNVHTKSLMLVVRTKWKNVPFVASQKICFAAFFLAIMLSFHGQWQNLPIGSPLYASTYGEALLSEVDSRLNGRFCAVSMD